MPKKGSGWGRPLPEGFEEFRTDGRRRCWGRSKKADGGQCGAMAMTGQNVCRYHGGSAKQSLKAAERRVAEAELTEETRRALAVLDVEPVDNPLTALSELAGQVIAWKNALAERVNHIEKIRFTDDKGSEQLRAEILLYERAMDRCINVLNIIGRLNIDDRLARITEAQAEKLMGAIDAALFAAGIQGDAVPEAKRAAARHLRSVG